MIIKGLNNGVGQEGIKERGWEQADKHCQTHLPKQEHWSKELVSIMNAMGYEVIVKDTLLKGKYSEEWFQRVGRKTDRFMVMPVLVQSVINAW